MTKAQLLEQLHALNRISNSLLVDLETEGLTEEVAAEKDAEQLVDVPAPTSNPTTALQEAVSAVEDIDVDAILAEFAAK